MDPNLFYLGQYMSLTSPGSECDSKRSTLLKTITLRKSTRSGRSALPPVGIIRAALTY